MKRCIVVGSMPVSLNLKEYIKSEDIIICADGGYIQTEKQGIIPHFIIGDFDSSIKPVKSDVEIIELPKEKDDTDTYYIAKMLIEEEFTDALFFGVTGGRIDHTIGNIQMIKFLQKNGINAKMINENSTIQVLEDGETIVPNSENCYLSILSMNEKAEGITIKDAKYPLINANISNEYPIGVSNEFLGKDVFISVNKGAIIIITNKKD